MERKFIIGTRDSLLAVTQTKQIQSELERLTGKSFELKLMKTAGDLLTEKPLWQLDGKNFFTKELDEALISQKVDIVISSYKDLGSERPDGISLAAVTKRNFPNDILLIKKEHIKNWHKLSVLKIGTSSPRRIANLSKEIMSILPHHQTLQLEMCNLRGNVNTRISKLQDDQYHAIVLAFAGLERLASSAESNAVLKGLLKDLNFVILPLTVFPSAPAQGALALECRSDDREVQEILRVCHDEQSAYEIGREREIFSQFGGGCHLAIGVFAKKISNSLMVVVKGEHGNSDFYSKRLEVKRPFATSHRAFVGVNREDNKSVVYDHVTKKTRLDTPIADSNLLISSPYCTKALPKSYEGTLWASGTKTHKALAEAGFWVNGSCEALGESVIRDYNNSKTLKHFFSDPEVKIVTSRNSKNSIFSKIAIYERSFSEFTKEQIEELAAINLFYWSSFDQFKYYVSNIPSITNTVHCCGVGKTYQAFVDAEIEVVPFLDIEEFMSWFKKDLV